MCVHGVPDKSSTFLVESHKSRMLSPPMSGALWESATFASSLDGAFAFRDRPTHDFVKHSIFRHQPSVADNGAAKASDVARHLGRYPPARKIQRGSTPGKRRAIERSEMDVVFTDAGLPPKQSPRKTVSNKHYTSKPREETSLSPSCSIPIAASPTFSFDEELGGLDDDPGLRPDAEMSAPRSVTRTRKGLRARHTSTPTRPQQSAAAPDYGSVPSIAAVADFYSITLSPPFDPRFHQRPDCTSLAPLPPDPASPQDVTDGHHRRRSSVHVPDAVADNTAPSLPSVAAKASDPLHDATTSSTKSSTQSAIIQADDLMKQLRCRSSDGSNEEIAACDNCRRRKTRCDRMKPCCDKCLAREEECTTDDILRKRGPPSKKQRALLAAAGLPFIHSRVSRKAGHKGLAGEPTSGLWPASPPQSPPGVPSTSSYQVSRPQSTTRAMASLTRGGRALPNGTRRTHRKKADVSFGREAGQ
ncbi:hypothetical protein BDZ90DRAFT_127243 [Jaminaea rosea]|uniref:Zn(2)-C6 fungal-type domain-containing protein n=1 Tax=Jaminaea rosea TaxID=1569628 RepID=A0A316UHF4_9BASI|nr:hypothetical protein BDZ90DRAFT_127243 [Jaminaea rosea]PWN24338.1 hypothetical protein BDZ90DRAFT_127243 [Jaminaea rosea]